MLNYMHGEKKSANLRGFVTAYVFCKDYRIFSARFIRISVKTTENVGYF